MQNIDFPWHPGLRYAGQSVDWIPTDTKESFDRMMQDPAHEEYFKTQGWLEPDAITYKINKHGFRCNEFETDRDCMIALGCSYTMGTGLPVECLWPSLIGQRLGLETYNLAWGGTAADTCYRLAHYWIPLLKPKLVCMLVPPKTRIELIVDANHNPPIEVFMPQNLNENFSINDNFLKHWWLNDENGIANNQKNVLAIQQIAFDNRAKFVCLRADEEMSKSREELEYARDHMHAGPKGHRVVAEKMLGMITWP